MDATPPPSGKNPSSGYQRLRLGVDVPVGSGSQTTTPYPGQTSTTSGPNYRLVGTSIDAYVILLDDGRYDVRVNLQDSSIFPTEGEGKAHLQVGDPLAFRTFSMDNHWPMKDKQTLPFATATDKVTGETLRVDVTLAVVR